jgi:hypothetical protein
MRRDQPLHADWRTNAERPILSASARAELLGAVLTLIAALYLLPAAKAWLKAEAEAVQTSALTDCRPPTEYEQLHVVVLNRAGRLVSGGCLYVGTKGTYTK